MAVKHVGQHHRVNVVFTKYYCAADGSEESDKIMYFSIYYI